MFQHMKWTHKPHTIWRSSFPLRNARALCPVHNRTKHSNSNEYATSSFDDIVECCYAPTLFIKINSMKWCTRSVCDRNTSSLSSHAYCTSPVLVFVVGTVIFIESSRAGVGSTNFPNSTVRRTYEYWIISSHFSTNTIRATGLHRPMTLCCARLRPMFTYAERHFRSFLNFNSVFRWKCIYNWRVLIKYVRKKKHVDFIRFHSFAELMCCPTYEIILVTACMFSRNKDKGIFIDGIWRYVRTAIMFKSVE